MRCSEMRLSAVDVVISANLCATFFGLDLGKE